MIFLIYGHFTPKGWDIRIIPIILVLDNINTWKFSKNATLHFILYLLIINNVTIKIGLKWESMCTSADIVYYF